jgi:hypothetical protein
MVVMDLIRIKRRHVRHGDFVISFDTELPPALAAHAMLCRSHTSYTEGPIEFFTEDSSVVCFFPSPSPRLM